MTKINELKDYLDEFFQEKLATKDKEPTPYWKGKEFKILAQAKEKAELIKKELIDSIEKELQELNNIIKNIDNDLNKIHEDNLRNNLGIIGLSTNQRTTLKYDEKLLLSSPHAENFTRVKKELDKVALKNYVEFKNEGKLLPGMDNEIVTTYKYDLEALEKWLLFNIPNEN